MRLRRFALVLLTITAMLAAASPAAAVRDYSVARENSANYGVRMKLVGPGASLTCVGPGPGFVYLAIWQGTNGGDPDSWVELGYSDCDTHGFGPVWLWAQSDAGTYSETIIGVAAFLQANYYKIYSHVDGEYRVFINGAKMATTVGWDVNNYAANSADAGLEVVDHFNSTMTNRPVNKLKGWLFRDNRIDWEGKDWCEYDDPPAGGKWTGTDKWRTDLNQALANSVCP